MSIHEHVTSITPKVQAPQRYASRWPDNSSVGAFYLDAVHALQIFPVVSLELCVAILQRRKLNKTTNFGEKSNTPSRGRPYYRGGACFSAY